MQNFTKTVTKQFNTSQYKTTHYNAKQNITTQNKTIQNNRKRYKTIQNNTVQNKARPYKTIQNKTKKPIQCRTIKYSSKTIQYIAIQYITI